MFKRLPKRKFKIFKLFVLGLAIILLSAMILVSGSAGYKLPKKILYPAQKKSIDITEEYVNARLLEFQKLYQEKQSQGYNLSEANELGMAAKQAYDEKDYNKANELLDQAYVALGDATHNWTLNEYLEFTLKKYPFLNLSDDELIFEIETNRDTLKNKLEEAKVSSEYITKSYDWKIGSLIPSSEKNKAYNLINLTARAIDQFINDLKGVSANISDSEMKTLIDDYHRVTILIRECLVLIQRQRVAYLWSYHYATIEKYKPKKYKFMRFSVYAQYASYLNPKAYSTEQITKEIDLLSETGVDMIRIDLVYDFWMNKDTASIAKIDTAINQIRKNNKKVYIAICGSHKWLDTKVDWETWKKTYMKQIETVVTRYSPDYVNLVVEGTGSMQKQVKKEISGKEWANFTIKAAGKVKELSPNTFVVVDTVVNTRQKDLDLFAGLMKGENIDAVGLDFFDLKGLDIISATYLPRWNKEKELWVGQTWSFLNDFYLDFLCDDYITATVYYAQFNDFGGYNLFFGNNLHTTSFDRTPAFYAYKNVIEDVTNN